ncbi:ftsK/SpoIIIE family protein [Firmicutes bacterium CAG:170]|nr:ftsK/SpoIIIE family protein [Firmicutes bacterium CAG:170]
MRREIGAFVCLFLGIFTVLCCFHVNAVVLNLMASLFKGTIGAGFYILPFSFLLGFLILLLHDGRPVALRVTCAFLLAATIGALAHVFSGGSELEWSWEMFGELWDGGISGAGGGILSGFLAELLSAVISRIGAAIVLLAALLLELITCLNMTIGGILTAIRERPRAEYAEPQREHPDPAQVIVNHVAQKQIERTERKRSRMSEFDLPVDDPPMPVVEPEAGKKEKKNAPVRPDVFVENSRRKAAEEKAAETAEHGPDILAERPKPVKDYKKQLEALRQEELAKAEQRPEAAEAPQELPHQFPPLILENRSADGEETETAEAPEPVEEPLPEPVCMLPEKAAPVMPLPPITAPAPDEKPIKKEEVHQEAAKIAQEIVTGEQLMIYHYPPVELLRSGDGSSVDGTEEMRQNADRLSDTLQSFGIEAHIINVTRGPSVTRYELELSRGIKLSKVTNLADDIALSLGASGVRIAAIPDKISVVGIEVPNRIVSVVLARDVIDSPEFRKSKSRISFAVGKDIGGNRIIGDIAKLPHMLIAGTTGSGKSVCMNSLIISLLYKAKPDEVKLIMVDPKMVELGVYNGVPHLLIPVVTDPKKAAGALQWAVTEMMRRYRMMADAGVRDLESYNKIAEATEEQEKMPQIIVVIDELADLMLVAAKEVEESICRVAQMGRAAGMHLVIATQRPSADVITGLMKANIPSRIAFAVASAMESRIILDTAGAEKLVGKGDMLYAPLGQGKPKRVQGCFITDAEVQSVVDYIKKNDSAQYSAEIQEDIERRAVQGGKGSPAAASAAMDEPEADAGDEMMPAAVEVLLETGQASVSMLQRRLKLGYARAARIMDELEEKGIVGPFEGSKPRQMLITREQWQAMKDGTPLNPPVEEEIP